MLQVIEEMSTGAVYLWFSSDPSMFGAVRMKKRAVQPHGDPMIVIDRGHESVCCGNQLVGITNSGEPVFWLEE